MALFNSYAGNYQNPYLSNGYYYPNQPIFYPNYLTQVSQQAPQQSVANGNNVAQSGIIWIKGGDDEAKMFPVAPNTAVALWSETEPVVYLKQADATGKPILKIYDLVERIGQVSESGSENFASKEDVASLIGMMKGLGDTVGGLKSEIETMKSDMYGIAGKKRVSGATKKTEVEEDG